MRVVIAAAALLALAGCEQPRQASSCPPPLRPATEVHLFVGGDAGNGRAVSEAEWAAFMAEEVTPRFPDGLSVIDVARQYREPSSRMVSERSKLVVVVVFDAPAHPFQGAGGDRRLYSAPQPEQRVPHRARGLRRRLKLVY